jgi:hypothetical protein
VAEYRLFDPEDPPPWLDPEWWRDTPNCNHLAHPAGVHNARLEAVADLVVGLFIDRKVASAVDMGAGDGALLELVRSRGSGVAEPIWGYEIIRDSVRYARDVRGVKVAHANVVAGRTDPDGPLDWGDLVICTEMLEHLADPHAWARTMAQNARWLIASSPWNETPRRHEDNHAWAWDAAGYREMLTAAGWEVREQRLVTWSQVVVACRPGEAERVPAAEREAAFEPDTAVVSPWRPGEPGLRSTKARAAAVDLGFNPDGTAGWSEYAFMNSEEHP